MALQYVLPLRWLGGLEGHRGRPEYNIRGHSTTTWTEFCNFLTPFLLRGQFLYPECGQKHAFFDPLPPYLVHVVILKYIKVY